MAILAGVLLIIAALLNFFAGMTYVAKGKITSGVAGIGEDIVNTVSDVAEANDVAVTQKENINKELNVVKQSGTVFKFFGLFLYLSSVILITAAVFLFQGTNGQFVFVAGMIALVAEILGGIASKFGVTNTPGLLAGLLAIYLSYPYIF